MAFNAFLSFWIGSQFNVSRLPLPLLSFISPMTEKEDILHQGLLVDVKVEGLGTKRSAVLEEPCQHAEVRKKKEGTLS